MHQSNFVNLNNHRRPSDDWPYELRYTITKSALPINFSFSFLFTNFELHKQKGLKSI